MHLSSTLKTDLKEFLYWFALLVIIFVPAGFYFFPFQTQITRFIFGWISKILGLEITDFSSDSSGLYWLVLFLGCLGLFITFLIKLWPKWIEKKRVFISIINTIIVFYLASRLMVYGFDKIFKTQFYLPEPNTVYTPFGLMTKDILFWSVMGTSKIYCIVTGIFEVLTAGFLLFKKTRLLGLLLTFGILTHVLVINLGFDISVKLYSLLLLILTLVTLKPYFKPLYKFFILHEKVAVKQENTLNIKPQFKRSLKVIVVGLILVEAFKFPLTTGYFLDDNLPRHELHGAYQIEEVSHVGLKRFYFHRRNFLIFQYAGNQFESYQIEVDQTNRLIQACSEASDQVILFSYKLYHKKDAEFITLTTKDSAVVLVGRKIEYRKLPALQDEFHWTIESYK